MKYSSSTRVCDVNFISFYDSENVSMGTKPSIGQGEIIRVALELAAQYKWRDITLSQISNIVGISLSQLISFFPSKNALVVRIMEDTTRAVVNNTDQDNIYESPRDRLFDILLRRIEVLSPNKIAIKSIIQEISSSPVDALCLAPELFKQFRNTLEVVGFDSTGLSGQLRVHGVAAIYVAALFVWFRDDSSDMGKTTAFLDRRLKQFKHLFETESNENPMTPG